MWSALIAALQKRSVSSTTDKREGFFVCLFVCLFQKTKRIFKKTNVHFVKYSQSTQNFDGAGKTALASNFTAVSSHVERSNNNKF